MRTRGSRQTALAVLAVVVVVLTWLVVRAGQVPPAPGSQQASATATYTPGPGATDPTSGLPWVPESSLPPEARHTLALIRAGGPFPYPRNDNQTFANRERLLPAEPRGYYREFTVVTPGSPDRGPRRIITGSGGEKYWTADHYASFDRIREGT
ncbi:ribonuclease domain-containing protein [Terrabacter sp. NPDC080008]|uniref:ribonuclease domain-containing protein n=1 Tax=Terrabacter sp. NPDC080008 TaxID=3155176 RepID=UPI0034504577